MKIQDLQNLLVEAVLNHDSEVRESFGLDDNEGPIRSLVRESDDTFRIKDDEGNTYRIAIL